MAAGSPQVSVRQPTLEMWQRLGQADSSLRPFVRRRARMRLPPRVRMRIRNPWVFFLFRVFG
jgi:hypothetical protein